jgi:hypothetical protein
LGAATVAFVFKEWTSNAAPAPIATAHIAASAT